MRAVSVCFGDNVPTKNKLDYVTWRKQLPSDCYDCDNNNKNKIPCLNKFNASIFCPSFVPACLNVFLASISLSRRVPHISGNFANLSMQHEIISECIVCMNRNKIPRLGYNEKKLTSTAAINHYHIIL